MAKKKATKKAVMPQGKMVLGQTYVKSTSGKLLNPGSVITAEDLTPERLKELKAKGLIKGTMTTEEKGTITK